MGAGVESGGERKSEIDALFRRGLTLFNAGRFYDAHEVLEDAWRETPRGCLRRRHLQGMVQLAVAFHHQSRENFVGARSVLERGLRNIAGGEESFADLDLDRLRAELAEWQRYLASTADKSVRPKRPRIVVRRLTGDSK